MIFINKLMRDLGREVIQFYRQEQSLKTIESLDLLRLSQIFEKNHSLANLNNAFDFQEYWKSLNHFFEKYQLEKNLRYDFYFFRYKLIIQKIQELDLIQKSINENGWFEDAEEIDIQKLEWQAKAYWSQKFPDEASSFQ